MEPGISERRRSTARMRSPYVRVYREEKQRPVLLVVDQRASMFFGSVRAMKSVTAAEAAAVAAHRVLAGGDAIGALIFGDREVAALPPRATPRHLQRMLGVLRDYNHALGRESPPPDPTGLDRALEQVARLATHNHLVLLISDLYGASADNTRRLATEIRRRNDLVVLWVHDPLELALPPLGAAVLSDGRMQVQVDTSDPKVAARFADDVSARRERAEDFALRYDVPLLPLSTAEEVAAQLRRLIGRLQPPRRA